MVDHKLSWSLTMVDHKHRGHWPWSTINYRGHWPWSTINYRGQWPWSTITIVVNDHDIIDHEVPFNKTRSTMVIRGRPWSYDHGRPWTIMNYHDSSWSLTMIFAWAMITLHKARDVCKAVSGLVGKKWPARRKESCLSKYIFYVSRPITSPWPVTFTDLWKLHNTDNMI